MRKSPVAVCGLNTRTGGDGKSQQPGRASLHPAPNTPSTQARTAHTAFSGADPDPITWATPHQTYQVGSAVLCLYCHHLSAVPYLCCHHLSAVQFSSVLDPYHHLSLQPSELTLLSSVCAIIVSTTL